MSPIPIELINSSINGILIEIFLAISYTFLLKLKRYHSMLSKYLILFPQNVQEDDLFIFLFSGSL